MSNIEIPFDKFAQELEQLTQRLQCEVIEMRHHALVGTVDGERYVALSCVQSAMKACEAVRVRLLAAEQALSGFAPTAVAQAASAQEGVAGDHCEPGSECGRIGCPECQQ